MDQVDLSVHYFVKISHSFSPSESIHVFESQK